MRIYYVVRTQKGPDRIIALCYLAPNNKVEKMLESVAILQIKGGDKFSVKIKNADVDIVIGTRNGVEYLKTAIDDTTTNNLLSIPDC